VGGENYGKWNGIIGSIFRVCRPPIFVVLLLALTFDALALKGYFDFLPKFYENNYSPSLLKSALPFWIFSIGIILGGIVFRLAKLDGRKAAFYMFICALLAAIFSLAQSLPSFSCNNVVRRLQLLDYRILPMDIPNGLLVSDAYATRPNFIQFAPTILIRLLFIRLVKLGVPISRTKLWELACNFISTTAFAHLIRECACRRIRARMIAPWPLAFT